MRKVVLAALAAFFALTSLGSAQANSVISTSPISGSTINSAPSAVTISTQVTLLDMGSSVTITDPQGARVDDGNLTISDTDMIVGLTDLTISGIYTVTYSLLAENENPLEGTFTFTFKAPAVITQPTAVPTTSSSATPVVTGKSSTSVMVIGLIFSAFLVVVLLIMYARKIIKSK